MSYPDETVQKPTIDERVELDVTNLGGINSCSVEFQNGVNLLTGRNATNRTSLLRAVSDILGGTNATLKSDADEGHVTLTVGDREYSRHYKRTETGVQVTGEPYMENNELIDLFISLLEDNPARLAIERGDNLREIIMRPVDTAEIERRIQHLKREREQISAELDQIERRSNTLPNLEEKRQTLSAEIESLEEEIEMLRSKVTEYEANAEMAEEAEELVDRLDERRKEHSELTDQIDLIAAEIDALKERPAELRSKRDDLSEDTQADLNAIQGELRSNRNRKRKLENTVSDLASIVEFNEDILSESISNLPDEPSTDGPVTELAPESDQEVTCWTCGNRADRGAIADRLENLRNVVTEKRNEISDLESRINELENEQMEIRDAIEERERLSSEINDVERKLEAKKERKADLEAEVKEVGKTISELESDVADTEELRDSDLLETYEQISDLQYEQGQKQQELASVEEEIDEIESLPDKSTLQDQLDEIRQELNRERGRVAEIESESVSKFNKHMDEVLNILNYRNISRVWIERKESQARSGDETTFDLHLVRESGTGSVYEDIVANLSESEREVIGLVVALAGYLVHEVYQEVPFVLLDSLEAIDSERIADLVEYFSAYSSYLIVALLPEDASRITDQYTQITADQLS
ncbi:archaea-specific SMC-related protein [Natrinema halophilum]|uniref:archaea-specific SMC-related protein n=1 Tax=Natrinema halophilum TaxID=1699371 RepID=UPI001F17E518|nr:archaea-specific SMC-related protein [Natrinema halophilum]UHQ96104.1 chromosome segregation protein SMC [Natrinema halophilum]